MPYLKTNSDLPSRISLFLRKNKSEFKEFHSFIEAELLRTSLIKIFEYFYCIFINL